MRKTPYILYITSLIALLCGCNPRLSSPQIVEQKEYIFGKGFSCDSIKLNDEWWQMFDDTTLNHLVTRALARNKSIESALSRIAEARYNLGVVRSTYLPTLSGELYAEGRYNNASDRIVQSYKVVPMLSWELSLFGALRHATQQAKAEIEYEVWQYYGTRLSLEAEVATTYFTLLQYQRELAIAKRSSELRRDMLSLVDSLHRYGFASGVHLEQAKSLLYTAEADIPLYEKAIAQSMLSLATLTNDTPETFYEMGIVDNSAVVINDYRPYDISIGAPSDIIMRRPDLMSAYYTLQERGAAVGIARSARLPSISLSLLGGVLSADIASLFTSKAFVADGIATLTQPLFNFGGLRRSEMVAREQYHQAILAYEQCYIEALSDVESALATISTSHEELLRYAGLVKSYRNISVLTYSLYRNGLSDYLDVIDAERSLYSSQMQFEALVAQQYINYINLCKALGGGAYSREE